MYADFEFYSTEYDPATELSEDELRKPLLKASLYLDGLFLYPPKEPVDIRVKYAACEIADILFESASYETLSSESNDGYSVSFDKSTSTDAKLFKTACRYLGNTGLLYRGEICE